MSQGVTRAGNYGYEEIEGTYDVSHMHHESHVAQALYMSGKQTMT